MKAEELMIGDWVFGAYRQRNAQVRALQLYDCDENHRIVINEDGCKLVFREEFFDPIPLTPEILEKNEFKKSDFPDIVGQHRWACWTDTRTRLAIWTRNLNDDTKDGWMVSIDTPFATYCNRIEYVHQLQHALKLCGINKEIIL